MYVALENSIVYCTTWGPPSPQQNGKLIDFGTRDSVFKTTTKTRKISDLNMNQYQRLPQYKQHASWKVDQIPALEESR